VENQQMTFGEVLYALRKKQDLTLRQLASTLRKSDGTPVSFQYVSELENDRRNPPPDYLIDQLATALKTSRNLLYLHARRIPNDVPLPALNERKADLLYEKFRGKAKNRSVA
jgi:transcriptional regulator with XRE-family HTH domain